MQSVYNQKKVHSETKENPEVPPESAILQKSSFAGAAIKVVMNHLIVLLNYNLQTGVQDVWKAHIGRTVVG